MSKNLSKVMAVLLLVVCALAFTSCGKKADSAAAPAAKAAAARPTSYVREADDVIYENILGSYGALLDAADAKQDPDERYVLYAQAEAALLSSATFLPMTTRGGRYGLTRVAPRTVPYVKWGNDEYRLHKMVVVDKFITKEDRAELLKQWEAATKGGKYDPAAYLKGKGYTQKNTYVTTFQTAPVTLDWLNTSSQADTEITVNCVDGLIEYDNLNQMQPALAESWSVSADGTVYTFNIRKGVNWYTAEGQKYAEVTAEDFVAGFHHMLDTQAGLEWLVDGLIVGATDYYSAGGSWDAVGYKAVDKYTLQVTLERPTSYFMTMLAYSCFLPMCDSFYKAHGGVYGVDEYAAASADANTYTFGKNTDVASQVYCGPFLVTKLESSSEIVCTRNKNYWNNATTTLETIRWVYDNGEDLVQYYNDTVAGVYTATAIGDQARFELAKKDGNFDKYGYITDTEATTYFGGLNLNRGTFALDSGACASSQTEDQKISTHLAMQNQNFRKAVLFAINKENYNAVSNGETALNNLRNMYTSPDFVSLSKTMKDAEGHSFPAGTFYGDMVQYYLNKAGFNVNVADGVDGWYKPEEAKAAMTAAVKELGDTVTYPINIDIVYYSASDVQTAQLAVVKNSIESVLGADKVVVNMIEATTSNDYYACGYRAMTGEAENQDLFYGSGWGPDYGDPKTYLDTMKGYGGGYMSKVIGLF
ncbi:MAG: ABC transporter substrate-binding protein [Treponemataceae bacterium]|nr:ABC transporter substrate-binding protein [Treponemataceae bacterium]